jgi:hypothetical protein
VWETAQTARRTTITFQMKPEAEWRPGDESPDEPATAVPGFQLD